jgi:integrase/recombinase XerD
MPDASLAPSFTKLVQSFFAEHLVQQRALSPRTVAAYRDTFRLLLTFAEKTTGKSPTRIRLADFNAKLVLAFLAHLEKVRKNAARSRNARYSIFSEVRHAPRRRRAGDHSAGHGNTDEALRSAYAGVPFAG